jgi:hypothetical protein
MLGLAQGRSTQPTSYRTDTESRSSGLSIAEATNKTCGKQAIGSYFSVPSIFAQACATAVLLDELLPGIAAQPPFSMNTI